MADKKPIFSIKKPQAGEWFSIIIDCPTARSHKGNYGDQFIYDIKHEGVEKVWFASPAVHKELDPVPVGRTVQIRMMNEKNKTWWESRVVPDPTKDAPADAHDAEIVDKAQQLFGDAPPPPEPDAPPQNEPEPHPSDPGLPFGEPDRQDLIMLQNATGHAARLVSALILKDKIGKDSAVVLTQQYAELIFAGYKNHK